MSATPALLLAAGGVGVGHAVLPDHWLPLAVVGRTQRYSIARVARLSTLAGLAHVLVSVILGGVIIVVGLQFRGSVESAQSTIVGSLLIATGLVLILVEATGHGHRHAHAEGHSHAHGHVQRRSLLPFMVSFGAAASPDLTILPVFLAATAAGVGAAVGSLIVFAAVTVATFVLLTVLATVGGSRLRGAWLEKNGNLLTAGMLLVLGMLVLLGVI
jgi:nickel/cobalt transporter (NicO) family protein